MQAFGAAAEVELLRERQEDLYVPQFHRVPGSILVPGFVNLWVNDHIKISRCSRAARHAGWVPGREAASRR
ncbi:hypothetical protein GCM10010321_42420 [Streptomyces chartreusis]|nr:hypothetical protein GCM10010321_42420 [Streptomyces chartreusis]